MIKNFPMLGLQRAMGELNIQPQKEFGFNPHASVATFGAFDSPQMVRRQGQTEPLRAPFQGMPGSAGVPRIGFQNTRRNTFSSASQPAPQWWGNPIPQQTTTWPSSAPGLQSTWPAPSGPVAPTLFGAPAPQSSGFGQWGSTTATASRPTTSSGFGASTGAFGSFTGVQPTWGAQPQAASTPSPWGASGFGAPAQSSPSPWGSNPSPWGKPSRGHRRGGKRGTKRMKKGKKQTKRRRV